MLEGSLNGNHSTIVDAAERVQSSSEELVNITSTSNEALSADKINTAIEIIDTITRLPKCTMCTLCVQASEKLHHTVPYYNSTRHINKCDLV